MATSTHFSHTRVIDGTIFPGPSWNGLSQTHRRSHPKPAVAQFVHATHGPQRLANPVSAGRPRTTLWAASGKGAPLWPPLPERVTSAHLQQVATAIYRKHLRDPLSLEELLRARAPLGTLSVDRAGAAGVLIADGQEGSFRTHSAMGVTTRGGRSYQEDAIAYVTFYPRNPQLPPLRIYILTDGMGGTDDGKTASLLAQQAMLARIIEGKKSSRIFRS